MDQSVLNLGADAKKISYVFIAAKANNSFDERAVVPTAVEDYDFTKAGRCRTYRCMDI